MNNTMTKRGKASAKIMGNKGKVETAGKLRRRLSNQINQPSRCKILAVELDQYIIAKTAIKLKKIIGFSL
jgi:hypothetical protein